MPGFLKKLHQFEQKWGPKWYSQNIYKAVDFDKKRKKYYVLVEFPYPSNTGLHMGHCRSYTMADIFARLRRMKGLNVLFPMGWDAFGLPTYNYAVKVGRLPQEISKENIANFKKQLVSLGASFDWSREIDTTDPKYYKWTQWIFIQLYKHWYDPEYKRPDGGKGMARPIEELPIPEEVKKQGPKAIKEYQDKFRLAYKSKMPVYYCPYCKIGVADEEVEPGGTHERCHQPLEQRFLEQWVLRITAYADRLIEDLDLVDYTDAIKRAQRNWIGRKYGVEVDFDVDTQAGTAASQAPKITIFTTRLDTIYGVSFLALSPSHSFVKWYLESAEVDESTKEKVKKYVEEVTTRVNKDYHNKEKTGVFTGMYAKHPLTGERVPIYVADFVLDEVGTGAIMGVPAHDQRDYEFAQKYGLPIRVVIVSKEVAQKGTEAIKEFEQNLKEAYTPRGILVNSGKYSGLTSEQAVKQMLQDLGQKGIARQHKYYKLRDWIFSRQHYWGEPTPMVYCQKCGWNPVPEDQLPVELPELEDYRMAEDGTSPLQKATEWIKTQCPVCGGSAKRETDVMPNWAGSNWYYLRYLDPHNDKQLVAPQKAEYWMPVDFYDGGAEHTTMHLLYSRFIYKFLYDIGVAPTPEPYKKRRNHGLVLAPDGKKMSKSRGNVINPLDVIEEYGADVVRMYVAFMGPYDSNVPWSDESIKGVFRFLERFYNFVMANVLKQGGQGTASLEGIEPEVSTKELKEMTKAQEKEFNADLNRLILKVQTDIESLKFNTAVAALMEFLNKWEGFAVDKESLTKLVRVIAPFAPFMAEELWEKLGQEYSVHLAQWPKVDTNALETSEVTVVVQVNGKVRGQVRVAKNAPEEQVLELAKKAPRVAKYLEGKQIKKVVYVPGRVVNIVI